MGMELCSHHSDFRWSLFPENVAQKYLMCPIYLNARFIRPFSISQNHHRLLFVIPGFKGLSHPSILPNSLLHISLSLCHTGGTLPLSELSLRMNCRSYAWNITFSLSSIFLNRFPTFPEVNIHRLKFEFDLCTCI